MYITKTTFQSIINTITIEDEILEKEEKGKSHKVEGQTENS